MSVTRDHVATWLRSYVRAWETYDRHAIGDLFTEDATYRYHPFDEPVRGRDAIVASWLEDDRRDPPGTFEAVYRPIAVDGDLAVSNGQSRYFTDASRTQVLREYDNIFVMRFGGDGRCRSFEEWYMGRRGQQEPAPG